MTGPFLTHVFIVGFIGICCAQVQPIIVPPSNQWDGVDGPWSTFNLGVGRPVQEFRGIPGTSSPMVMLPTNSAACNKNSSNACRDRIIFNPQNPSYTPAGFYDLPLSVTFDPIFPDAKSAEWGSDEVFMGFNPGRDLGVARQYIAQVPSINLFLGIFGLSVGRVGFSAEIRPTLLSALLEAGSAPSNSFSYTAGCASRQSVGSLIFGGYDTSRFDPSTTISIDMPNRNNNTLLVLVKSISIKPDQSVQAGMIKWPSSSTSAAAHYFRVDSVLPQIWLPLDACAMFEKTFDLTWDDASQLYTISEQARVKMLQQNATVQFTLAARSEDEGKMITMSFAVFNLQLFPPLVSNATYYFPLRRATNPMQYVLGRAFLQEAYLVVDYERANFSLSQAWESGGTGRIMTISNATGSGPGTIADKPSASLSTAAYAGIGVGAALLVLLVAGLLLCWKKQWLFFNKTPVTQEQFNKLELHGEDKPRVEAMEKERAELEDKSTVQVMERERVELQSVEPNHEISAPTVPGLDLTHELDGDGVRRSRSLSRNL